MIDTRQKLIDTAETLFADQGYGPVSLRQIIAEAGVNLAAVHYHFGSKEELLDAIIGPKVGRVNEERLARLALLQPEPDGRLNLADILAAFLEPMATAADSNPQFVRLMGRIHAEGLLLQVGAKHFQPVFQPFFKALQSAAPHLTPNELGWRIHFMMGAVAHTMCNTPKHTLGIDDAGNYHARIARLMAFLCGALSAPAAETVNSEGIQTVNDKDTR